MLAEGQSATDKDLQSFAGETLAPFKVPKVIVFLDEIPKGATGKMQRIGLASSASETPDERGAGQDLRLRSGRHRWIHGGRTRPGGRGGFGCRAAHLAAMQANVCPAHGRNRERTSRNSHRRSGNARPAGLCDYRTQGPFVRRSSTVSPRCSAGNGHRPGGERDPLVVFHGTETGTGLDGTWLETVDPGGAQWKAFRPERAIGCVVYPACDVPEPGVIQHKSGNRFTLGEPDGSSSERVEILSKVMIAGGLKAPRKATLRDEIWIKLWGNCSFNPVSALTGASLDLIGAGAGCRSIVRDIMLEARAVGTALGARFNVDIERRIQGGADIVGHKPSTRHDVELGRPMEIDALVSTVQELARRLDVPTPTLDTVASLLRMQGSVLGLYDRRPDLEDIIVGPYEAAE